jgi:hypothetical protein
MILTRVEREGTRRRESSPKSAKLWAGGYVTATYSAKAAL